MAAGLLGAQTIEAQHGCGADQVNRRGVGCVCRATGRLAPAGGCPCPPDQVRCDAGSACIPADGCCGVDPTECGEGLVCVENTCVPACTATTSVTGEITDADPFHNSCVTFDVPRNVPFETIAFVHCGGPLTLSLRDNTAAVGATLDPVVSLYQGAFQEGVCTNLLGSDDNSGPCDADSPLSFPDLAAGPYTVVMEPLQFPRGPYILDVNLAPPPCA